MLHLVTADQMRALDAETIERIGVSGAVLMESAGRGVVSELWALSGRGVIDLRGGRAVVLAGPGNNGGDGLVIARYLHTSGVATRLVLCAERERVRGDALAHLRAAERCGVPIEVRPGEAGVAEIAALLGGLGARDVIVDALLGTGVAKPVTGPLAQVIAAVNRCAAVKVAVDLPSGLDADRGVPAGSPSEPAIVRAQHTVTFGFAKLGLCGAPGFAYAGDVSVVDIGIPAELATRLGVQAQLLGASCMRLLGRPRQPLGHKGTHGHLLLIAGSRGKTGAAQLAARAALRTGVGLCTVAAPTDVSDALLGGLAAEAMTSPYPLEDSGEALARHILAACTGKHAVAIGPGLPTSDAMKQALLALLAEGTAPLVLDADALNAVVGRGAELRAAAARRPVILTPHPGEAARLLGETVSAVQADRTASARKLCRWSGAVVALKGARTIVAAPAPEKADKVDKAEKSDRADKSEPGEPKQRLAINPTGNAGMGSGGMGDVLTGMTGALLAAGFTAWDATCAAVYWHGLAGDRAAAARPTGSILLAGEVIEALDSARQAAVAELTGSGSGTGWPARRI